MSKQVTFPRSGSGRTDSHSEWSLSFSNSKGLHLHPSPRCTQFSGTSLVTSRKGPSTSSPNDNIPSTATAEAGSVYTPITQSAGGHFFHFACSLWCNGSRHTKYSGASGRRQQWYKTFWGQIWGLSFSTFASPSKVLLIVEHLLPSEMHMLPPVNLNACWVAGTELHTDTQLKAAFRTPP